jgi:hypothetical protein
MVCIDKSYKNSKQTRETGFVSLEEFCYTLLTDKKAFKRGFFLNKTTFLIS